MDSTALSTFMRAKESLEKKGISLRLTTPSKAVERILAVTGFGDYFDIYPSREAAIPG
jgi:anti-sigma B factor antagonist